MNDISPVDYQKQLLINMIRNTSLIDDIFSKQDFTMEIFEDDYCMEVAKWIRKRYMENKRVSIVKLQTESNVDAKELLETNINYQVELKDTDDILEYLVNRHARKNIADIAKKLHKISLKTDLSREELNNLAQEEVFSRTSDINASKGIYTMEELVMMFHKQFTEIQNGQKKVTGMSTGIPSLDYALGGFQREHETVTAARTSMGKTSLAILIAKNMARLGYKGAIFSLEMSAIEIITKIIALDSRIPTSTYTKKIAKKHEKYITNNMNASMDRLFETNLIVSDARGLTTTDIKARCRNLARKMGGLDFVVVDYLQMISLNGMQGDNEVTKIGNVVLDLRNMAGELNIHVNLLAQFNRSGANSKPQLSHLRGSGNIEEIADEILFPYRDNYDDKEFQGADTGKIYIGKGRTSGTGSIDMMFYPSIQYWRDMVEEESEGPLKIIKG